MRLDDIARSQGIPNKFLVHIMLQLKQAGIVESKRGAAGGYFLVKEPGGITVGEMIRLFDGPFFPTPSSGTEAMEEGKERGPSPLALIFGEIRQLVEENLDNLSFAELVRRVDPPGGHMYYI